MKDILSHYNSLELRQIAEALDTKIGDLRDTIDVLKTIGREHLGGQGVVAKMTNGPDISRERINRDIFNPKNEGTFHADLKEIKDYLLSPTITKSKSAGYEHTAQNFKQGTKSIKDKIFS